MCCAFKGGSKGRGNVVFNFTKSTPTDMAAYAGGYRRAAECVLENIFSAPSYRDNDCYPVFFLYRHALELYLKAVVIRAGLLMGLTKNETYSTTAAYKPQDLSGLPTAVQVLAEGMGWSKDEDASEFERIAEIVGEVSDVDASSFVFRYPTTTTGLPATEHHFVLNVIDYANDVEEVLATLDGMVAHVSHETDLAVEFIEQFGHMYESDE